MIKIAIIDDQKDVLELLSSMLSGQAGMKVVGCADNHKEAIDLISEKQPQVVLLDIEMPEGPGFEILQHFKEPNFKVIVVSAHSKYAIKALKLAAIDYIVKPVVQEELIDAIKNGGKILEDELAHYGLLKKYLSQKPEVDRLVIPSDTTKRSIKLKDIIYMRSDGGYTIFYLTDNTHILTSRSIKYYQELLPENLFFRTHKSYMVNFHHVGTIPNGRSGQVELSHNKEAQVSVRRAPKFRKWYKDQTLGGKKGKE